MMKYLLPVAEPVRVAAPRLTQAQAEVLTRVIEAISVSFVDSVLDHDVLDIEAFYAGASALDSMVTS
jgi:hypothetical protein